MDFLLELLYNILLSAYIILVYAYIGLSTICLQLPSPIVAINETLKLQLDRLREHNACLVSHVSKLNSKVH